MATYIIKVFKAYELFWAVAIICGFLVCVKYVSGDNAVLDINVHDTYYVIAHTHLYTLLLVLYLITGLLYWFSRNLKLVKALTAIHTIVTVGAFIASFILKAITKSMYSPENIMDNSMEIFNTGITMIFLLVAAIQPLLPINLIIGIIKGKKQ